MKIKYKIIIVMTVFIMVMVAVFFALHHAHHRQVLLEGIDSKLYASAIFAEVALPTDYHDLITDKESVSEEDYLAIVEEYNSLCSRLGLQYLWSVMLVEEELVFTSGTSTSKDINQGDYALFFEKHTNPRAYAEAFETMKPTYSSFSDEWGSGRMVLIPEKDSHGRKYLFAASMSTPEIEALLKELIIKAVITGLIFLGIGLVSSLFLARGLSKPVVTLRNIAEKIAGGDFKQKVDVTGSIEIESLSRSLQSMSDTITDKVRALREKNENLDITLNSIGDAVIATDGEGKVVRLNPVAEKLTGWKQTEAQGEHLSKIFRIVNSDTRDKVESPLEAILATGKIVGLANHTVLIAKGGTEYQIADSGAPIKDSEGNITGVVIVFRDVTDSYKMEAELRHAKKMDAVGKLAGGIAHDFNNLLASITGAAELLRLTFPGSEVGKKNVNRIMESASRAAELTQKLLAFSRKGKVRSEAFDAHDAVSETLIILEHSISKGIEIVTDLEATESVIEGDFTQIQSSLINLATNARDAMPEGGQLIVMTSNVVLDEEFCSRSPFNIKPGEYLEISVTDTGVGMSRKVREQIFDPFYTTKESGKGTGLGLAAVYGTVKEHNGVVHVYSEPGKGSVFKLYFPVVDREVQAENYLQEEIIPGSGSILVVDDEDIIRAVLQDGLKELGYETYAAADGEEAVRLFRDKIDKIDGVVLDLVMPNKSGWETFQVLREIKNDIPILVASGFKQDTSVSNLLGWGNCDFIQKPFRRALLSQKLHDLLNS